MTKRIVSGIFILTALGALGVILAGALTSGEQLIVRFLTAVVVAGLGLYVISDLRLQTGGVEGGADASGLRSNRSNTVAVSPNSTAAFMATVTGPVTERMRAEANAGIGAPISLPSNTRPASSLSDELTASRVHKGKLADPAMPFVAHSPANDAAAPHRPGSFAEPEKEDPPVLEIVDLCEEPQPPSNEPEFTETNSPAIDPRSVRQPIGPSVSSESPARQTISYSGDLDPIGGSWPLPAIIESTVDSTDGLSDDSTDEAAPSAAEPAGPGEEAPAKVGEPNLPVYDKTAAAEESALIDLRPKLDPDSVDKAIKSGERDVINSLIRQGMLTTSGPVTDRDVRTMVYVAFTSNELRKLIAAGGDPEGANGSLDLGPVELFDERKHRPAPRTFYTGLVAPAEPVERKASESRELVIDVVGAHR